VLEEKSSCLMKNKFFDFLEFFLLYLLNINLLSNSATLVFTSFAIFFFSLFLVNWGLCSPVYSILFRNGYNYFSNCSDAMPKESMIYNDFIKLRDDFSYYSVFCGFGAFFVYFGSSLIVAFCSCFKLVSKFCLFIC
jgi:hypothetical protein